MSESESKDRRKVSISMEALAKLRPLAEKIGVPIPGLIQFQAKLDIDEPDTEIARQLGALCSRQPIFRRGEDMVALDDEGQMTPMTPKRFGGWCEKFVTTYKKTREKGEHAASMQEGLASRIMVNDAFRVQVRKLVYDFPVRLPVLRKGGALELLEPGYDEQTQSWTEDSIPYDLEWDLDKAKDWLVRVLGEWPWADLVSEPVKCPSQSRNAAVILTGMLGTYCRAFLRPGEKRPALFVSGSQPGTGKSTLARMVVSPVYGLPPEMDLPKADDKFARLLESVALGYQPVLFLDDVGAHLKSTALNRFVTASVHSGVRLYSQSSFEVPSVTQCLATGNDLSVESDLTRRSLWCELFLPGEIQGREFKYEVTDTLLSSPSFRTEALSAMWAIVREWASWRAAGVLKDRKILASFESYSRMICGITQVVGWRDPLDTPEGISGGDLDSRGATALLLALADGQASELQQYTLGDLIVKARSLCLLERFVGIDSDGDLKKGERVKLGRLLGKFVGRILQRTDGSFFQFGKRDGSAGSIYPCRLARTREEFFL